MTAVDKTLPGGVGGLPPLRTTRTNQPPAAHVDGRRLRPVPERGQGEGAEMKTGKWRQVGRCQVCSFIIPKPVRWLNNSLVPVCPECGTYNNDHLFEVVTARAITRWRKTTLEVMEDD